MTHRINNMNEESIEGTPLPSGWTLTTVNVVGAIRLGRQRSPDKHTGVFPTAYLRAANIKNGALDLSDILKMDFTPKEQAIFGLHQGDIVLAEASGSASQVGRAAIWQNEIANCCYQNTVIRFRPHAVLAEYALLVFRHFRVAGIFAATSRGVGIQHLGAGRFAELAFPLPPSEEQRRIATEVQKRLANLIGAQASLQSALQRSREQEREVLAAAVEGTLVSSGVIEDVRVSVAQRSGSSDTTSTAAQSQLFNVGDEAPIAIRPDRHLPSGWKWEVVGNVGDVRLGKQLSPASERGPHKRPYLRVANVFENRLDISDVKSMHFSDDEYATYQLETGDILLNEGQSPELVGRPAMYLGEPPGVCFQNTLIRFRAHSFVNRDYALIVFRHYLHSGEFQRRAQWSTNIAHLGLQRFAAMPFPVPPLATQQQIVTDAGIRLAACGAQTGAIEASLAKLPAMEAEVLSAAVHGALVAQDPSGESAMALLGRVGPPPSDRLTLSIRKPPARGENTVTTSRRGSKTEMTRKQSLSNVLREAGGSLSLPDLFSRAGYDRDSTGDVEQFYLALRDALNHTIQQSDSNNENASVEVIYDAPR
jgi:type I restriction enzyme S subunit